MNRALLITFFSLIGYVYSAGNSRVVNVIVEDGMFKPDVIGVNPKLNTLIRFDIKDSKLCKEKILIKGLGIVIPIKEGQSSEINIKGKKPGKYHVECETGAFCGVLFIHKNKGSEVEHIYHPKP